MSVKTAYVVGWSSWDEGGAMFFTLHPNEALATEYVRKQYFVPFMDPKLCIIDGLTYELMQKENFLFTEGIIRINYRGERVFYRRLESVADQGVPLTHPSHMLEVQGDKNSPDAMQLRGSAGSQGEEG